MTDNFDVDRLKNVVRELLVKNNISTDPVADKHNRGDVFAIQTEEALMKITIGSSWAGYELEVDKAVTGEDINIWLDTDNYPLGNENTETTKKISAAILQCAESLINREILVGRLKGKSAVALPQENGLYEVKIKGRIVSSNKTLKRDELTKLRPLV